jgi:predicted RNA-binding protein Jag
MKKDIIVTAKTIEDAVLEGASKLGVAREDVEIEVLEEPKRAFSVWARLPQR